MNACVKTGARVHCVPYDYVFSADLFQIAGAMVVRANGPIVRGENTHALDSKICKICPPTHELHDDRGRGFWREDLGIFVIPADCLKARVNA